MTQTLSTAFTVQHAGRRPLPSDDVNRRRQLHAEEQYDTWQQDLTLCNSPPHKIQLLLAAAREHETEKVGKLLQLRHVSPFEHAKLKEDIRLSYQSLTKDALRLLRDKHRATGSMEEVDQMYRQMVITFSTLFPWSDTVLFDPQLNPLWRCQTSGAKSPVQGRSGLGVIRCFQNIQSVSNAKVKEMMASKKNRMMEAETMLDAWRWQRQQMFESFWNRDMNAITDEEEDSGSSTTSTTPFSGGPFQSPISVLW